jgi:predicted nucleic acid-binding protein
MPRRQGWDAFLPRSVLPRCAVPDRLARLRVIGVTQPLVELAADLALNYDLRGFDAIHLASALLVRQRTTGPVRLLAWDRRLASAAAACELAV